LAPLLVLWPSSFGRPWLLLCIVAIPLILAAYLFALSRRNKRGMRFTNTSMLDVVVGRQSQWRRHIAVVFALLTLVLLSVAAAKPTATIQVARERATIVVVMDVSQSMQATDIKPNRLAASQEAAKAFVDKVPAKYNIALVTLSGQPSIIVRPTTDHALLERAIDSLKLADSTAIGDAIEQSLRAIQEGPVGDDKTKAPGAIVLLSDGGNTTGSSATKAAEDAKKQGVPIYTIPYGTPDGYVDLDGERFPVPVDSKLMQQIAQDSGGASYSASSASQLASAYEHIGSKVGYVPGTVEVTNYFVGYGLLFAVLAVLAAISMAVRWP